MPFSDKASDYGYGVFVRKTYSFFLQKNPAI